MFIRHTRAALLLSPLLSLAACSDIDKCPIGVMGCLQGRPFSDGTCEFDLVVSNNRCVRPGDAKDDPDGIDYCADWTQDEYITYVPPAARCSLLEATGPFYESLTSAQMFDELCFSHCVQDLVHARQYCGSEVDFTQCNLDQNPGLRTNCTALAMAEAGAGASQDLLNQALESLCQEIATTTCLDTDCLDGNNPICAQLETDLCFDDCTVDGDPVADDGFCDDGDAVSADTNDCDYGHDCTDCGPRTKVQRNAAQPAEFGEACVTNAGCEGFDSHFESSTAFCTFPSDDSRFKRCLVGCNEGRVCPEDTTCETVTIRTATGAVPLTIYGTTEAQACFPTMCE